MYPDTELALNLGLVMAMAMATASMELLYSLYFIGFLGHFCWDAFLSVWLAGWWVGLGLDLDQNGA
jgi:hypothetical protein